MRSTTVHGVYYLVYGAYGVFYTVYRVHGVLLMFIGFMESTAVYRDHRFYYCPWGLLLSIGSMAYYCP